MNGREEVHEQKDVVGCYGSRTIGGLLTYQIRGKTWLHKRRYSTPTKLRMNIS